MFITRAIFSDEFYQFVNSTLTQSFIILQLPVVDLTFRRHVWRQSFSCPPPSPLGINFAPYERKIGRIEHLRRGKTS